MKITHDLKIDLVRPEIVPPVAVVQGDTYTREIKIVLHANGESWGLPNEHDIVIRYSKPDGTIGIYDTLPDDSVAWSSEGNTVSVMLAPQMLTCPGKVSAQVSIIVGSSIISTFTFFVIVEADPSKGAVRSENYNNWRKAFVPQTTGAKVGQFLQISKVDASGRIIEVVPVENPAGEATNKAYEALRIANDVAQEIKAYSPSGTRSIAEDAMRMASERLVAPAVAAVGRVITVSAVDENGAVTAVEAVDAPCGGGEPSIEREPAESDVPLFFFGSALPQTKDDTIMPFRYVSRTLDIKGYCKTKAQGTSSLAYPKKNQTTKIYADADCTEKLKIDFRGWGKQHKFCLKANWIDITNARNIVSARLWGDVVKSRSNYAELPELLRTSPNHGAVDGFPVRVYAGGVYQGRYTLNIPKDGWMANMDGSLDNHCILCGEGAEWGGASGFYKAPAIDGSDWSDELHDTVPASIKNRWTEVVNFVMNSTDAEFRANLGNYFDVLSLIDYYLFGLASCHSDGFAKNQLYFTYDGLKWYASAYDMDATWGLVWNGSGFNSTDLQDYLYKSTNLLYGRLAEVFQTELKERWIELRSGALSEANIFARFEQFIGVCPPHLVAEDYTVTTGGGAFTGIPSTDTNNIQQIRQYAVERLAWSDMKMGIDSGSGSGTTYTNQIPLATDTSGSVFNGKGYMEDRYLDQGNEGNNIGTCVTGFIPCKVGDVLRLKNMPYLASVKQCRLTFYDANKRYINQALAESGWYMDTKFTGIKDDAGNYICFSFPELSGMTANMAYVRITAISITDDSVVTINEPIE